MSLTSLLINELLDYGPDAHAAKGELSDQISGSWGEGEKGKQICEWRVSLIFTSDQPHDA